MNISIDWNDQTDFPEILGENGFSIDVFAFNPETLEKTIAWYCFNSSKWCFIGENQCFKVFKWRYFIDGIDYYKK